MDAEVGEAVVQLRSEEHTSELQSRQYLVCRLLLEKKNNNTSPVCTSSTCLFFFFNDTATTEIYTLSLHDALPISSEKESGVTLTTPMIWNGPLIRASSCLVRCVASARLAPPHGCGGGRGRRAAEIGRAHV